jgi:hypothetical protein
MAPQLSADHHAYICRGLAAAHFTGKESGWRGAGKRAPAARQPPNAVQFQNLADGRPDGLVIVLALKSAVNPGNIRFAGLKTLLVQHHHGGTDLA